MGFRFRRINTIVMNVESAGIFFNSYFFTLFSFIIMTIVQNSSYVIDSAELEGKRISFIVRNVISKIKQLPTSKFANIFFVLFSIN